jgi:hypothetical protein
MVAVRMLETKEYGVLGVWQSLCRYIWGCKANNEQSMCNLIIFILRIHTIDLDISGAFCAHDPLKQLPTPRYASQASIIHYGYLCTTVSYQPSCDYLSHRSTK